MSFDPIQFNGFKKAENVESFFAQIRIKSKKSGAIRTDPELQLAFKGFRVTFVEGYNKPYCNILCYLRLRCDVVSQNVRSEVIFMQLAMKSTNSGPFLVG